MDKSNESTYLIIILCQLFCNFNLDIQTQTLQNFKIFLLINSYIFTIPSENFISGVIVFWTLKVGLGATVIKTEIMNGKEKHKK